MEKTLIKGAIYSFLIATLVGLLLFPDWGTEPSGGRSLIPPAWSAREYILRLLRFDALVTLMTLAVLWFRSRIVLTDKRTSMLDFLKGILLAFCVGLVILFVFSFLLGGLR
ncbi:hypothetical protein WMW72_33290 [Paenibacillus filicis]|uniref:Uncharacterized protein n=1 Tax=Paenibacillus filicis TaxID=669464 RepID=A0ABU9DWZ3_9BACL